MNIIANHNYFTDVITTQITYPGDATKKITFEDPDTNQTTSLNFPGNPIFRQSVMIYANGGYYHTYGDDPFNPTSILYKDAGYEGVRSFAIVTTKVTDEILKYWLDQKDKTDSNGTLLYANGPMKAAYGTFLTSLMMIKCHDMIADQAAAQYNVTWTRTTPIVVSVFDDAYRTVMTLECDHRFGMDVTGAAGNVTTFRYACSSAINPLEHYVMKTLFPDGNGTSIVMGIGEEIFNGQMPGIFLSNGYLVFKSSVNNMFLIFDPTTGILRDVMYLNGTVSGAGCFSDLQTEWIYKDGIDILSNPGSATIMNINAIGNIALNFGGYLSEFAANIPGLFNAYVPEVVATVLAASVYVPPVFCIVAGAVVGTVIFQYCVDQGWLPPERCREICGNAFLPFALINTFLYDEPTPTIKQLQEAYWKTGYLLMAIDESGDTELYEYLSDIGKDPKKIIDETNNAFKKAEYLAKRATTTPNTDKPDDDDDRESHFYGYFVKKIKTGVSKLGSGDITGLWDITLGTAGLDVVVIGQIIDECYKSIYG